MKKRLSVALGATVAAFVGISSPAMATVGPTFHVTVDLDGQHYSLDFPTIEGPTAGTWLATSVSGENTPAQEAINALDWTHGEDNTFHGEGSGAGFSWVLSSAGLGWVDGPVKIFRNNSGDYDACRGSNDFWCNTVIVLEPWPTISAPEPSTWALMGLGFAALGFAGYRSRRAVRAPS